MFRRTLRSKPVRLLLTLALLLGVSAALAFAYTALNQKEVTPTLSPNVATRHAQMEAIHAMDQHYFLCLRVNERAEKTGAPPVPCPFDDYRQQIIDCANQAIQDLDKLEACLRNAHIPPFD